MSVKSAVVHPLVLLNCVDHYNRVAKNTSKRVVGVLLGKNDHGNIDITK
jgi:26S proteasome regulatory subunit N8